MNANLIDFPWRRRPSLFGGFSSPSEVPGSPCEDAEAQPARRESTFPLIQRIQPSSPSCDSGFRQIEFPRYGTHRSPALADQLHGFGLELVRESPSMSLSHFGLPSGGYFLQRGVHYEGTGSGSKGVRTRSVRNDLTPHLTPPGIGAGSWSMWNPNRLSSTSAPPI